MFFRHIEKTIASVKKHAFEKDDQTLEIKIIEFKNARFFRLFHNGQSLGDYKNLSQANDAYYRKWAEIIGEKPVVQASLF